MNVSKPEQRTLHVLALGGVIIHDKNEHGKVTGVNCITRDGWTLYDCTLHVFTKLRKKRLIASRGGKPYRITRAGRDAVRPQYDNRA